MLAARSRKGRLARAQANGYSCQLDGRQLCFSQSTMLKWQLVGLTEYERVLYTDSDVDLFLHSAGRPPPASGLFWAVWLAAWRAFDASGLELISSGDPHVPINTGVMLLRPSSRTYQLGLDTLRAGATWVSLLIISTHQVSGLYQKKLLSSTPTQCAF